jgi:hypothetical protein
VSKSWKAAESRVGVWLGAKGIGKSGRLPLSGGNSGVSRSDHPHPTIFNECKRDKSYKLLFEYWWKLKTALQDDYSVIIRFNDGVICFHCNDVERILAGDEKLVYHAWPVKKLLPKAYKLYLATVKVKESSDFDKAKKVTSCSFIYHNHRGFWFVMKDTDVKVWWECVLEARIERERLLLNEVKE